MRLFSEKVTPTFTSSNQNILTIKDFNEIFFDVYELEINGNKYIAEKISEYKGNPVVNIPIVIDGRELEAPFVIQRGSFDVIFNESNSTFIKVASTEIEEVFIEEKTKDEEVEEIIFEKKESILEEIKQARQAATKFAESIQQKNIRQERERTSRDKEVLAETASNFKKVLLEEFLSIAENTREELFTYTQQENEKTYDYITETVNQLAEKLTLDLNEEITSQHKDIVERFEKDISSLAQNILTDKLLKEIAANNSENIKATDLRFETVSKTLTKVLSDYEIQLDTKIKKALDSYKSHITALEQTNVELNDSITKSTNKALSRIGNVKTQLEESIDSNTNNTLSRIDDLKLQLENTIDNSAAKSQNYINNIKTQLEESIDSGSSSALTRIDDLKLQLEESVNNISLELVEKITLAESKIKDYYDDRINLIESSVVDITAKDKAHILELIEESKQSILKEVNSIKNNVPSIVVEKTLETQGDVDLKKIKTDLEKSISNRFSQELSNVRRIIELSSGGGSVAQQFANGGTMNGNLTVVGAISASQYLGIPIYTDTDTLSTVTGRGNTTTDSITVGGMTVLGGLTADRVYTTQLDALSANITVIDIKQYELSGFDVQGNATIQGSVSASGSLSANNLVYKGGNADNTSLLIGTNDGQQLNFETNGLTRMSVTSAGDVGIGITTPTAGYKLDVTGALRVTSNILSQGSILYLNSQQALTQGTNSLTLGGATYYTTLTYGNASTTNHNFVAGSVGIGTVTPNEKLTVSGNISASNDIYANGSKLASASDLTGFIANTFETVSKNLKSYAAAYSYLSGTLTSITYNTLSGNIVKNFYYTGDLLTSISLSGNTPSSILSTKTFTYSGSSLTNISYS